MATRTTPEQLGEASSISSVFNRQAPASPHRFLVTSRGASATRWLCFALASHAGVFVAHGKHTLDSIRLGQFDSERRQGDTASLALGNVMSDFYRCRSLGEVFDTYGYLHPGAQACGNVHTYCLEELSSRFDPAIDFADTRILNLIRHPVTYIASHASMIRSAREFPALRHHWREGFEQALEEHSELLLLEYDEIEEFEAFVVSCHSAALGVADLRNRTDLHVKMEEVTTNVDCLLWCCEYLTQTTYDRKRLNRFIHGGPINRHRKDSAGFTPGDVYRQWKPWQRMAAALLLPDELLDQFVAKGYDVTMLQDECRQSVRLARSRRPKLAMNLQTRPTTRGTSFAKPVLVEENYRGFNLVRLQKQYVAVAQSLGVLDLTQVGADWWTECGKQGRVFVGESLADVKRQVDQSTSIDIGIPFLRFWHRIVRQAQSKSAVKGRPSCSADEA